MLASIEPDLCIVVINIGFSVMLFILIWQPIYGQPVYVGIYLLLAPVHSNYQLGNTNVLKIDLKCPEKYIKAYNFFLLSNELSSNLKMLNTLAYI